MEYLGDDASAYKRLYEIKTKDDPKSWADLIKLFRVLNETPAEKLEAALAPILDVDGALKFLALEVALVNSDGYWTRASDYSIYQDEKGRFHVIPHDMNEGLADEGGRGFGPPPGFGPRRAGGPADRGGPVPSRAAAGRPTACSARVRDEAGAACSAGRRADLDPLVGLDDTTKPLRSKLLAVPALRQRYLGLRARDRAEAARLEDARPARRAVSGAHRRGREGRHAEAVQHRGVQDRDRRRASEASRLSSRSAGRSC